MPVGEKKRGIRPSRQNLFRIWLIRSILVIALLSLLAYLRFFSEVSLPWLPLLVSLLTVAAINLLMVVRLMSRWPVGEVEVFANLLFDILFLTIILYFTGGSTNPLVSYYLIPLIISAAVLRPCFTWAIAALTIACYSLLFFHYVPLALFSMGGHGAMMGAHFWGMWINFAFSALLISWFVVRMAATMREQEHVMGQVREDGMRDEQIISVASIAAGTAHELRTPLATMMVVVDELKQEQPGLDEEMSILEGQLERCDSILRELLSATAAGSQKQNATLEQLFTEILAKWGLARPEVSLKIDLAPDVAGFVIRYDQSFHHALLNFLHNAADVSPGDLSLGASLETSNDGMNALILIEDRGPGIPEDITDALGRRYISRKKGGLGLGVLLSSASIERLGGQVTLLNRRKGGTRLEIRLPGSDQTGVES